ncbi:hypothetical protein DRO33_06230 [Candidatus Bathyarchaeota archaeon]|nr:MAG: hypothetical protein DRO33_06230 [Candidatus Bathyarchaeota archaeon]
MIQRAFQVYAFTEDGKKVYGEIEVVDGIPRFVRRKEFKPRVLDIFPEPKSTAELALEARAKKALPLKLKRLLERWEERLEGMTGYESDYPRASFKRKPKEFLGVLCLHIHYYDPENLLAFIALFGLGSDIAEEMGAISFEHYGAGFLISVPLESPEPPLWMGEYGHALVKLARGEGIKAQFAASVGYNLILRRGLLYSTAYLAAFTGALLRVDGITGFVEVPSEDMV